MAERRLWDRDELILALNLYLKLEFGQLHYRTKKIIDLAHLLGRTPGSIAMRLNNFASVDPYHQKRGVGGLPGGKKQVEPIWNEYMQDKELFLFQSEEKLVLKEHTTIEKKFEDILKGTEHLMGEYKIREVKTRVNQDVFRDIVIANYEGKCAVTGIDIQPLLLASHIIPWSENEQERLNPENGICLSAFYDRAFDKGYIGINEEFEILVSSQLKKKEHADYYTKHFEPIKGMRINMPSKYYPKKDCLQYHLDNVFEKHAEIS